jgi:hypothetical protein
MAKQYEGYVSIEGIVSSDIYNCDGCAEYSFFNAGNVNVTIDGILVIKPRETWRGPSMHPELGYYSKHKIEFDEANAPSIKTPIGGVMPPAQVVNPGDPAPAIDRRLLFFKTFIK